MPPIVWGFPPCKISGRISWPCASTPFRIYVCRKFIAATSCRMNEWHGWILASSELRAIDFLGSKEPIVQRFVARFENSLGWHAIPV